MVKEKSCLKCKTIFDGEKCPHCGETAFSDSFKGEAVIFNPEKSLIANNLKINIKGRVALKVK
jgi:DNA-directed RNA polymerase subunit E"